MIRWTFHVGLIVFATLGTSMRSAAQEPHPSTRPIREILATEGTNAVVTVAGRATVGAGQLQSSRFEIALS